VLKNLWFVVLVISWQTCTGIILVIVVWYLTIYGTQVLRLYRLFDHIPSDDFTHHHYLFWWWSTNASGLVFLPAILFSEVHKMSSRRVQLPELLFNVSKSLGILIDANNLNMPLDSGTHSANLNWFACYDASRLIPSIKFHYTPQIRTTVHRKPQGYYRIVFIRFKAGWHG
jgi:hypothetical protein